MTETKLSNASRDHVHEDLLIWNNFRRRLDEMCHHNEFTGAFYPISGFQLCQSACTNPLTTLVKSVEKLSFIIADNCQNTTSPRLNFLFRSRNAKRVEDYTRLG